ncbi:MAG TPA: polynucleotide adenylyltransferase PcnB [Spirochaetia bacterium]|nr:polynucleotide adenylyltransferase PcnB [Spirochaetia bacterium]
MRYGASTDGTIEKKAHIYTEKEHGVDFRLVDQDAVWVVRRLRKDGFQAYIVGGAVRDLLVGRAPNDFDIATDAHPQQVRRAFRSARIIGRRFRIVHVYCGKDKIIEVTTFRSRGAAEASEDTTGGDGNNRFGTMEEDAARRDFTINALYYCPIDRLIIDYVGGYEDVRGRRLRTLTPAEASFSEDPVRMIRAVKYSSLMRFPIPLSMSGLIRRHHASLLACSRERVTEEVYKILTSGGAAAIFEMGFRLHLFETIFPAIVSDLRERRMKLTGSPLWERLCQLDTAAAGGRVLPRSSMFGLLYHDLIAAREDLLKQPEARFLIQQFLRAAAAPLFPSRKDLAEAAGSFEDDIRVREARAARAHVPPGAGGAPGHHGPGRRKRRRRGRRRGGRGGQDG